MGLSKNFAVKEQEEGAVDGSSKGDRSCIFSWEKLKHVCVDVSDPVKWRAG